SRLSRDESLAELRRLREQNRALSMELQSTKAELEASNAHCTLMKHENGDLRTQLENSKKRKERNTSRRMARFITNQSLRSRYEQEKAEQEAKKQEQEQRRQEKEARDTEEAAYIAREAADRVFGSFASYKLKRDLIILARALGLSAEGTNIILTARIKDHLQANEQSLNVPGSRFAGLFRSGRGRAPQESCPV
ncbi:hypothetical protein C8Q72DRAFT_745963, partial [Fomitopsis betulina]